MIQRLLRPLWALYRVTPSWAKTAVHRTAWIPRMAIRPFASSVQIDGFRMYLDLGDNGALRYLRWQGEYEKALRTVFLDLIAQSPDCVVIDVGSSYGAYALSAAARAATHPIRSIIAIEPDERCMTAFRRSVAENGFGSRIRSVHALAGSYSGIGELHVSPASSTSNRSFGPTAVDDGARTATRTVRLRATRVDDEMQQANLTPPLRLVAKMDVEGSEPRVLAGMHQTLAAAESVALLFEYYPTGMRAVGLGPEDLRESLNGHTWTQVMAYEDATLREFATPALLWEHLARYFRETVGRHEAINVILLNGTHLALPAQN